MNRKRREAPKARHWSAHTRRDSPLTATGGDTAIAVVESLTHDARGVARIEGKATFIEGALPGERVRFRYHNKLPRFDTGEILEVLEPSADRVAPPCRYFGACGGCSLQHLAPEAQVRAKQQVLADALDHVGRVRPDRWLPPIIGPALGYRRRARFGVRHVPSKGGVLVGFRERRNSYITPLQTCLTLDPRLALLLAPLRSVVSALSRPDCIPQIEVVAGDEALAIVVRHLERLSADDGELLRDFARAHGITVYVQPGGTETIAALWPLSPAALSYALPEFNLRLIFAPSDFIQVNTAVNRSLVAHAVALLQLQPTDRVLDLFCGLGNFTLAAARRSGQVLGIEVEAGLIERARTNATLNRLENAEFRTENLYDAHPGSWARERFEKVLLDPPRAGAMEAIKAFSTVSPARIVYVSCDPATLARDSAYLVTVLGYRLEAAGIADMFPHTSHVESIALFTRN
jgi:23S rRNA (uracil1939-C5)-methyltransferase